MISLLSQLQDIPFSKDKKTCLPERKEVFMLLKACCSLLFPRFFFFENKDEEETLSFIQQHLPTQICLAFSYDEGKSCDDVSYLCQEFLKALPAIKKTLLTDIEATYSGDPAARSLEEIVLCYPGFYAIMVHRLAHQMYQLGIPYLPRMMSEYAHSQTGIDIHPGARIGDFFCIDHGTGIVIGETSTIGHHVKIYQGVTIGAKSFRTDDSGRLLKGGKRHPDIGNYVTVYANATILGADTFVADHTVIGGNVWISSSTEENQVISYKQK